MTKPDASENDEQSLGAELPRTEPIDIAALIGSGTE
jgi:hypothetical protein